MMNKIATTSLRPTRCNLCCRVLASRRSNNISSCQQRFSSSSSSTPTPQKKNQADHFHLFRIPRAFSIDEGQLKQQYRALMKELHPDVVNHKNNKDGGVDDDDDAHADVDDDTASAVTNAYDTLRRPHRRASHLMELLGHPLNEDSNETVSPEFLMDMMEWREQVANIDPDGNDGEDKLHELLRRAMSAMDETGQQLQRAVDEDDLATAHRYTGELQYWNRLIETLREAIPQR
jgi:molecular chaperone HscB